MSRARLIASHASTSLLPREASSNSSASK